MKRTLTFIVVIAAGLALVGCGKGGDRNPINGIGNLELGKTKMKKWGSRCNPPENGKTFCLANPRQPLHFVKLGEQNAQAATLWDGTTMDAPLLEIELFVENCDAKKLRSWLTHRFGTPAAERADKIYWEKEIVFISEKQVDNDKNCSVVFTEIKRKDRVAELKK